MLFNLKKRKLVNRLAILMKKQNTTLTMLDIGASGNSYSPFLNAENIPGKIIEIDPDSRDFELSNTKKK